MKNLFIGIDCGGTNIRVACGDEQGNIVARKDIPTFSEDGYSSLEARIIGLVEEIMKKLDEGDNVKSIAMGIPGIYYKGEVLMSPNIGNLNAKKLVSYFKYEYEITFNILNDVKCAALGEKWIGAAKGLDNFIFVNIGTGLSLAPVLDGRVYLGENNASGEFGYWVYDNDTQKGYKDGKAPLEDICSGKGISDTVKEYYKSHSMTLNGLEPDFINTRIVFEEYRKGNADIIKIIDHSFRQLMMALANLSTVLNPSALIFGGGVAQDIDIFIDRYNKYFEDMVPFPPSIRKSALGRDAGIMGALNLAIISDRV